MGEEPWRVRNVGAPGLDHLLSHATLSRIDLSSKLNIDLSCGYILFSFHPTTLELDLLPNQIISLLDSLKNFSLPVVFTYPNTDPGYQLIINAIESYNSESVSPSIVLKNAGSFLFSNLIVESASFATPTVNVGSRQTGKIHPANVLNTIFDTASIVKTLQKALSLEFSTSIKDLKNPYGDGHSGKRIAKILATLVLNDKLLRKKFIDL